MVSVTGELKIGYASVWLHRVVDRNTAQAQKRVLVKNRCQGRELLLTWLDSGWGGC